MTTNKKETIISNSETTVSTVPVECKTFDKYTALAETIGNCRTSSGQLNENHLKRAKASDNAFSEYFVDTIKDSDGHSYYRFSVRLRRSGEVRDITAAQLFIMLQDAGELAVLKADGSEKDILRGAVDGTCSTTAHETKLDLLDQYYSFKNWFVSGLTKVNPRSLLYLAEVENLHSLAGLPDKLEHDSSIFILVDYRLQVDDNITSLPIALIQASYDAYIHAGFDVKLFACYKLEQ